MKRTENGIDHFELRWKSFDAVEKNNDKGTHDFSFHLRHELDAGGDLSKFLLEARKKRYWVIPKYYFNGDDFTWWYNLNINRMNIFDGPGHVYNTIAWIHNYKRSLPWLLFQMGRMHGKRYTPQEMIDLGLTDSYWTNGKTLKEENETVQIFCCSACGERSCANYSIIITENDGLITWSFPHDYLRDFKFEYHQYSEQFRDYKQFVEQYGLE